MAEKGKVTKVLVAEQMSIDAMRDFAASESAAGRPTFFHEGDTPTNLQDGLHFVYKPNLTPAQITTETDDGSYVGVMVRPKKVEIDTNVEFAVRVGTGVLNLKDWWMGKEGRIAMNTPAQNAAATAEYSAKGTIELVAPTFFRRASQEVLEGRLDSSDLSRYTDSKEANAKTVVIAGMGDIGIEAAKRLKPWMGVKGWGYTRPDGSLSFPPEKAEKMGIGWVGSLEEGAATADVMVLHVKGEAQVVTRSVLEAAKPGIYIINAARAACIDVAALGDSVGDGKVKGFLIDADRFRDDPARDQLQPYIDIQTRFPDNRDLLVTPHFGGDVTVETNYNATMQGIRQAAKAVWEKTVINAQGFDKTRSSVPESYTDGGVEKPKGVGEIYDMSPVPSTAAIAAQAVLSARGLNR